MTTEDKDMYIEIVKSILAKMAVIACTVVVVLFVMSKYFHQHIAPSTATVILGVIGATLASIGNSVAADALTRWGTIRLPHWKWGNRIQDIGFTLAVIGLLIN